MQTIRTTSSDGPAFFSRGIPAFLSSSIRGLNGAKLSEWSPGALQVNLREDDLAVWCLGRKCFLSKEKFTSSGSDEKCFSYIDRLVTQLITDTMIALLYILLSGQLSNAPPLKTANTDLFIQVEKPCPLANDIFFFLA